MSHTYPNTTTQRYLASLGACAEARAYVADRTLAAAWAECTRLDWMQGLVTADASAEYQRADAAAWAEYRRVKAAAWAEFGRASLGACAERKRVLADASAEYQRATAPALAAYRRAEAAAWAEFGRAEADAKAALACDELRASHACPEIPAQYC